MTDILPSPHPGAGGYDAGMASRTVFTVARIALLALAAVVGYVAVYVPLMVLLFDKRVPLIFFLIVALSLSAAAALARWADKHIPSSGGG
jgi:hypothetical protein